MLEQDKMKQEKMEQADDPWELKNEELRDVAGGGADIPGTKYIFKCPACGWILTKVDYGDFQGYERIRFYMQAYHDNATLTPGCVTEVECIEKTRIE